MNKACVGQRGLSAQAILRARERLCQGVGDVRITKMFRCVARGFKARGSFRCTVAVAREIIASEQLASAVSPKEVATINQVTRLVDAHRCEHYKPHGCVVQCEVSGNSQLQTFTKHRLL